MAEIAKVGVPSYSSLVPQQADTVNGLLAGEDIAAGDACYIKASDGRIWRGNGTAANEAARVRGFAFTAASAGDALTLVRVGNIRYAQALVPGVDYFLSATVPGGLSDAATTGGTRAIAYAVDAQRIGITL